LCFLGLWNNVTVNGKIYNLDLEDDRGNHSERDADLPEWAELPSGELHIEVPDDGKRSKSWYDYVFCKRKPSKKFRGFIDKAIQTHQAELAANWKTFEARVQSSAFSYSAARLANLRALLIA